MTPRVGSECGLCAQCTHFDTFDAAAFTALFPVYTVVQVRHHCGALAKTVFTRKRVLKNYSHLCSAVPAFSLSGDKSSARQSSSSLPFHVYCVRRSVWFFSSQLSRRVRQTYTRYGDVDFSWDRSIRVGVQQVYAILMLFR